MRTVRTPMLPSMLFMLIAALVAVCVPAHVARGQGGAGCAEGWLPGEGVPGVDGVVSAVAVLPGGDVIAGGNFTIAGGVAANSIARYTPSTGVWSALGSGVSGGYLPDVYALAVLPGGDVIVGGRFTTAGGVAASNIVRYTPSTGAWSALGSGMNDRIFAMAVLPGGDVIVGGLFTTAGGVPANRIARYTPSTGIWSALGSGVSGFLPYVFALAVLPGGDVIAGGEFTTAGGVPANRIARYTPSTGVWSALGSGMDGYHVNSLAVLPGGDVIVGGGFSTAGGVPANNIARYTPSTGFWSALGSGVSGDYDPDVYALAVLPDGDVIVGGGFSTAGGVPASRIARYTPSTGVWSALGTGLNFTVYALAVLPGGDVIVGGGFTTAGGVPADSIARYTPSTGAWATLGSGTNNPVFALAVLPDGDVIAGGDFTYAEDVPASKIARYTPSTGIWSALGSGVSGGDYLSVRALAVLPGGDVIVGGSFSTAGGVPANRIARYTPSTGVWSALGSGMNNSVYALAVLPSGDVIVGGFFTSAGGVPASRIARYTPSTGVWSALGSGMNNTVSALAVLPGGDVIVGGNFTTAGGVPANYVARYNPSTGVWSALGTGLNFSVYALAVLPVGDVIVGGNFTTAVGVPAENIARYTPSTGVWSALGSGVRSGGSSPFVHALAVLPGGDVIVGGKFTTAGGVPASRIARYNPSTGVWSALGSGTNDSVLALAVLPGGDLIAGGSFTFAGGNVSAYFARYTFGSPTPTVGTQPTSVAACVSGTAEFTTAASIGESLTYQWQVEDPAAVDGWRDLSDGPLAFGGVDTCATVTGSREPTIVLALACTAGAERVHASRYRCTISNDCGSATSDPATLTICRADYNCTGGVSVQDVFDFLSAWFELDSRADFNNSGSVNVQDIFDFLDAWFAGC